MVDAGKGPRVLGFFVFQLGAGVILDSRADGLGALIALCGAAVFLWGLSRIPGGRHELIVEDNGTHEESTRC